MKKLFAITALLICCTVWPQDSIKKINRHEYFRLSWTIPNGIGDNVLNKANKGIIGLGIAVTVYTHDRYHVILGYDHIKYEVTDTSLASNAEDTNLNNFYVELMYKLSLSDKFEIDPKFSVGYFGVSQRSNGNSFGRQYGPAFTPGFTVDYRLVGNLRLFAGLNYCLAFPETHTNKEYKSFFGTLQQLNIVAGIKL
jgi:hypothetical protein